MHHTQSYYSIITILVIIITIIIINLTTNFAYVCPSSFLIKKLHFLYLLNDVFGEKMTLLRTKLK